MSQFYQLTLVDIRRDTQDAIVLTLDVPPEHRMRFSHQPGQHVTLRAWVESKELRRSYSLCNAAGEPQLRLAIKKVADGQFSQWAHQQLRVGTVVDAQSPVGRFGLPLAPEQARHYAAFAAGSGITPILSILETTLQNEPHSRFTLVYCNRNMASVQFREHLAHLKDRYLARLSLLHLFSGETQEIELFNGRLDAARCQALLQSCLPVASIAHAYICGPAGMMQAVCHALTEAGLLSERIRREAFAPAGVPALVESVPASVPQIKGDIELTLQIDGIRRRVKLPAPVNNLLDALLHAGIEPRYSCKAGVCATCRCRVLEGEVVMHGPHVLDAAELAAGYVLSCRSRVLTSKLMLTFD
ncbi:phenylacetic acid degradation protein [Verminephrobacter eiseniae]|uniref:2Fe-2S iron-sulfur cluster-binding protein n=1 Tax=Verminephrobacter eiseniae TaxID=364317 RepID=UPI002238C762|nr:2Fe-2S iron-sulfur cluster-binding protein [Verminephrobacter eiseniae]MCW5262535.1 phenylacetic acid degradation protein [Verminephrobacter eiseniae]